MPTIAILSFSPVARDARVLRQLEYLAPIYTVEAWGYGPAPELPGQNIVYPALPQSAGLRPRLRKAWYYAAVPTRQILAKLQHFDIGLYRLPHHNFNDRAATPNKFFDFIAAGLAVCIGPSPEMARLTEIYGFSRVAADFTPEALARTLDALTPAEIDSLKHNALRARTQLNAQVKMGKLQALYSHLPAGLA